MENRDRDEDSKNWPLIIRDAHGVVKIYKCLNNRDYTTYMMCYYLNGQRIRKGFASPELAKREARVVAKSLSNGWGSIVKIPLDRYKGLLKSESKLKEVQEFLEGLNETRE
jgi:hypothetical protein